MTALAMLGGVAVEVAVRATGVLAVATVLVRLMRRASAASRHLVWNTALAAVVLLPAAVVWAPRLSVPVLSQTSATLIAPVPENRFKSAPEASAIASVQVDASSVTPAATRQPIAWTWTELVAALWLAGAVMFLARGVAGRIGVGRLVSRSRRVTDPRVIAHAARIGARLRIHRAVTMFLAVDDAMALTWGLVSPKVLLPACATSWSDDRLDAVLVHELAHVARGDVLAHAIVRIATAVQWFNPLVWMAARHAHRECERACDDVVLQQQGARASHYASDLLALVQTLTPVSGSAPALAMARPSHLEERVLAILNPGANRRIRTKGSLIVASAIAAISVPVATTQLTARPLVLPAVAEARPAAAEARPLTVPTMTTLDVPAVPRAHAIAGHARLAQPARTDFSGRWTPIDSARANALFDAGRSSLPVVPMTISQDATTLTIVRAMPSLLRQPPRDWVVKVQLDGSETTNEEAFGLGRGVKNHLRQDGGALVIVTTDLYAGRVFEDVYTVDGDGLRVEESDGAVVTFVRATAAATTVQPAVNFAGVWIGDADRNMDLVSRGLLAPSDNNVRLTIEQDASQLTVSRDDRPPAGKAVYRIDGTRTPSQIWYPSRLGWLYDQAVSEARWNGARLETTLTTRAGDVETTAYSMDGQDLRVEITPWTGGTATPRVVAGQVVPKGYYEFGGNPAGVQPVTAAIYYHRVP